VGDKSTYDISSAVNKDTLEIIIKGELPDSEHDYLTCEVIDTIKTNSINRVLIDVSALKGRSSITETYSLVRNYPPHIYRIYFAMVNTNGLDEYERFHETTALNAGMQVKWFTCLDSARKWINSHGKKI
jgi:hypothetical protein